MFKPIKYKPLDIKPLKLGTYKQKYKPKKLLTYPEAKLKFNLSPYGDIDRDNRPNWRDCRPYDPNEHLLKELKETGGKIKEKAKEYGGEIKEQFSEKVIEPVEEKVEKYKEKKQKTKKYKKTMKEGSAEEAWDLPFYLIVRQKDGMWYNWGEYPANEINTAINKARRQPDVVDVRKSKNPDEHTRLNKAITKAIKQEKSQQFRQHVKQGAEDVGLTKEQILEKIKKGIEIKEGIKTRVSPTIRKIGESASQQSMISGPPAPPGWWRGSQTDSGQPRTQYIQRMQQPGQQVQIPEEYIQQLQEMQEPRKVPPGAVPYQPVSHQQSFVNYRPAKAPLMNLGMRTSMGSSTRPRFMMVAPQFRFTTMPKITFGRRIRREKNESKFENK